MKKLMLSAFLIGLVTASCGSKEPQMSSEKDSMNVAVDTTSMRNSAPVQNPDTTKMPVDTVNTPVR